MIGANSCVQSLRKCRNRSYTSVFSAEISIRLDLEWTGSGLCRISWIWIGSGLQISS